jgi:arylsulfatase A-like enzyme
MNKNPIILSVVAATVLPVAGSAQSNRKQTEEADGHPNLLFIMTDQQRYDALAIAGRFPFLQTPNLDLLATQGAYFTHAYTQCAVSAPARATILTGQTVWNHRLLTNELVNRAPDSFGFTHNRTFDQILAERGYYIEHHGKLHTPTRLAEGYVNYDNYVMKNGVSTLTVDTPMNEYRDYLKDKYGEMSFGEGDQWDTSYGSVYTPDPIDRRYGMPTNTTIENVKGQRKFAQPDEHGKLPFTAEDSYTAFQSQQVIEALERAKKSGKPFSVTCSYHFPHAPMLATAPYYGMYPINSMPIPASILDDMTDSPYIMANGRNLLPQYANPYKIRYMISTYLGLVTEIDHWVGELLATLDKLGVADNTLVVFLSDHGEMLGSHGMREKNVFFEESARIPMIFYFPARIKPTKVDKYVSNLDVYATILDYLGVKDTQKNDSESLRGMIEGTDRDKGKSVVTEWLYRGPTQPNYMVVMDGWKLYVPYTPDSDVINAMHDLATDPYEMTNLLAGGDRDKHLAKAEELKAELVKWLKKHNPEHADGVAQRSL